MSINQPQAGMAQLLTTPPQRSLQATWHVTRSITTHLASGHMLRHSARLTRAYLLALLRCCWALCCVDLRQTLQGPGVLRQICQVMKVRLHPKTS